MKIIDFYDIATKTYTHLNKEMAYQCYSVETQCHYPTAAANDPHATWIMLTPQSYKFSQGNFYISKF
jgi:hypothetical protein